MGYCRSASFEGQLRGETRAASSEKGSFAQAADFFIYFLVFELCHCVCNTFKSSEKALLKFSGAYFYRYIMHACICTLYIYVFEHFSFYRSPHCLLPLTFPDFDMAPKRNEKFGYCGLHLV